VQGVVVEPGDVLDDGELKLRAGSPGAVGDQLGPEEASPRVDSKAMVTVRQNRYSVSARLRRESPVARRAPWPATAARPR
jgi:hypothetical protein